MFQHKTLLLTSLIMMMSVVCLSGCNAASNFLTKQQLGVKSEMQYASSSKYSSAKTLATPVHSFRLGAGDNLGEGIYKNYTLAMHEKTKTQNKDSNFLEINESENTSLSDNVPDNPNRTFTLHNSNWILKAIENTASSFSIIMQHTFR